MLYIWPVLSDFYVICYRSERLSSYFRLRTIAPHWSSMVAAGDIFIFIFLR